MTAFTRIPENYISTLADGARFAFGLDTAMTVDLRIMDAADGALLSVRRFADTLGEEVDIAPVLRRHFTAEPLSGETALHPIDRRMIAVDVSLHDAADGALLVAAPTSAFVASVLPVENMLFATTMPCERTMAPNESDELILMLHKDSIVTITAVRGRERTTKSLAAPVTGVLVLHVAAADFEGAEQLVVEVGGKPRVCYTLLPVPQDSVRLAWRTECGSIERYTFPVVAEVSVAAERSRAEGCEGRMVAASSATRSRRLISAYERQEVAAALAGIITSPQVWEVAGEEFRAVEVLSDKAAVDSAAPFSTVTLTIREPRNIAAPWS